MASKPSWLRKFTVLMMAFAIVITYSIVPMNQSFAASKKPTKITVKATTKTVDVKGKATIKVTKVTPKGASTAVKYKSSNKKVATVNSKGVVTGKKKGTVKITVTSKANKKLKKTIKIKVKNIKPKKIQLSKTKLSLEPGKTAKLTAKATPEGVYAPVTWKSSNTKVATVDKKGNIKAVAAGTAKITVATTKASGKVVKATCTVTVKKAEPTEEPAEASEKAPTLNNPNVRTMTTKIDMSDKKYDGKVVRVWVPVAQSNDEQTIWGEKFEAAAADEKSGFKTEASSGYDNKMLYLEWSADTPAVDRVATLSYNVSRYEVSRSDLQEDSKVAIPDDVKPYITRESNYVKVNDPIVQKYAAEATKGKTGTLDKARAIYDWCIANLERIDNGELLESKDGEWVPFEVIGCGYGDTVKILTDLEKYGRSGGHCTDINSTFVALCRASGIPAREMFGIRLADNATGGQHCWAQFYLPGTGWTYADPGDVCKFGTKANAATKSGEKGMTMAELAEARKSELTAQKTAQYWGGVDNNRVELSRGRDITLEPAQTAENAAPYNTFGYPCGEYGTEAEGFTRIECTDAANFTYSISCADAVASSDEVSAVVDGTDAATKLVDARTADAFEGWAIDGAANGGHLKNAVNVSAQWLSTDYYSVPAENKTREESIQKDIDANGLAKDDKIIVYDTNGEDAVAVMNYLVKNGYSDVAPYDATEDFKVASNVEANEAYTDYYVPAEIVKSISDNVVSGTELSAGAKAVVGGKTVKILHAEWYTDINKTSYAGTGHVPGAVPVTTDDFEPERPQRTGENIIRQEGVTYGNNADIGWVGDYLLVGDADAIKLAEKYGVNKDDCVIVVGYEPMSTCKIALILKYLGVDSTYVMSAAYNEWNLKGYDLETKINEPKATSFGATEPLNPDLIDTQDEAAAMLGAPDKYQLVDTRTVEEFEGKDTGYGYHDIAGRIPGADVNSPSGIGYSSGMYFYRNADKTMRSKSVIEAMWKEQGVDTSKHLSFFCGSGWRAAEETWDALAMGYENVSMYNDGWQGWSNAGRPFIDKDGNELKLVDGKLVAASSKDYMGMTADEWAACGISYSDLKADDVLIDVRPDSNFTAGHLAGSLHSAVSNPITEEQKAPLWDLYEANKDSRIVIVCVSGNLLAKNAMTYLQSAGADMSKVTYLIGGAEKGDATPYLVKDHLDMTAEEWAACGIAFEEIDWDNDYLLDVRPNTGDYYKAGRIAGSVNSPVSNPIADEQKAPLLQQYENASGRRIVIVCVSGNLLAKNAMTYLQFAGADMSKVTYLIGGAKDNKSKAETAGKWDSEVLE